MEIKDLIDSYTQWLNKEIRFEKIGQYYEISTPFLDSNNDYIQFYVRMDGDKIFFTDDGFTINNLEMTGYQLNSKRKKTLNSIVAQYGVNLNGKSLETSADIKTFPMKKHLYMQAIMKIDDLFMTAHNRSGSDFIDDIQKFFSKKEIYYSENVQFTGTSGFSHKYEFLFQRSKRKPERLCRIMNSPNKSNTSNILFAWQDTKLFRQDDSKLIVLLNDSDKIAKGVEEAFMNYDAEVVKWSEREKNSNIELFSA